MRGLIPDPHASQVQCASRPRSSTSSSAIEKTLIAGRGRRGNRCLRFLSPTWRRSCSRRWSSFLLLGYPVAFSLAAIGLIFAFVGIELGLFRPDFLQALPERVYGVMNNDTLLAIPFFTFMGLILERSGMAEDLLDTIGQLFGTDPRRPRLCGDLRRRAARRHHRRGRRLGDLDGPDLAADHAALRLRPARRHRRHRRLRHAGADHSAVAGADRHGRPARPLGRRHVRGRLHSRPRAGRPLCRSTSFLVTMFFPKAAPGLPPEAIGFREDRRQPRPALAAACSVIASVRLRLVHDAEFARRTAPTSSCSACSSASCSRSSSRS